MSDVSTARETVSLLLDLLCLTPHFDVLLPISSTSMVWNTELHLPFHFPIFPKAMQMMLAKYLIKHIIGNRNDFQVLIIAVT